MNRKELVSVFAKSAEVSKKDAENYVSLMLESMISTVKKHGKLQLTNVFTIKTRVSPEREGRNPKNGKAVTIPERTVLSCKFGKEFKDAVNKPAKKAAKVEKKAEKKVEKKKAKK